MPMLPWAVLLLVVAVSACLTLGARTYALRRQMLDQPGERRSHQVATPRGGGIAIVVTLLLAMATAGLAWPVAGAWLLAVATGLVLVAGIGWWDDHRPLPAIHRLAVHLLAAAIVAGLVKQGGGSWLQAALALGLTVSLVNIWNFMDGINGIATTQAIIAALAFCLLLPIPFGWAGLVVAAACLGFLPFNFPRARIFMGDVGSGALGYLLACLASLCSVLSAVNWLLLVLPLSAFAVDAGFTLLARMLGGQRWMQPHTQHVYQRAVKAGASHAVVTCAYMMIGMASAGVLYWARMQGPWLQFGVALAWLLLLSALWCFMRSRLRAY